MGDLKSELKKKTTPRQAAAENGDVAPRFAHFCTALELANHTISIVTSIPLKFTKHRQKKGRKKYDEKRKVVEEEKANFDEHWLELNVDHFEELGHGHLVL